MSSAEQYLKPEVIQSIARLDLRALVKIKARVSFQEGIKLCTHAYKFERLRSIANLSCFMNGLAAI